MNTNTQIGENNQLNTSLKSDIVSNIRFIDNTQLKINGKKFFFETIISL